MKCSPEAAATAQVSTVQEDAAIAGERGLPISAHAPSFMPAHLTGPQAGKEACPLCVYGLVPQLQVWVQEASLDQGLEIADLADKAAVSNDTLKLTPYLVIVPSSGTELAAKTKGKILAKKFDKVFVTSVPSWTDAETSGLYGHADADRPGIRVYSVVNRRVFKRWDDPAIGKWPEIEAAWKESQKFVSNHEETDSQIAPAWEPGQRMEVRFRVEDGRGRPRTRFKVGAMQTDKDGHYNPPGWNRRDPRLKATAWTDEDGWITFRTIMPGPYPNGAEPSHIHFSAELGGRPRFRTLWFEGDPLLTAERRAWEANDEETLVVPLDKSGKVWRAEHAFVVKD
ncbi:MAG: hypothetical protein KIT11_01475 [Fimbriimonadaceae bacterium]|nr:hypothetical protein [Fimbriimonadaceae bacterium]QYK54959.1 MAG: hypothetical protein KF733_08060 [Fimbriimonadaceae bacterium]